MLLTHVNHAVSREDFHQGSLWGLKHPRTALLLPFFNGVLGGNFKFVHVLRDGKDVIFGDNLRLFKDHCSIYYDIEPLECPFSWRKRLNFWGDMNREILEYASANMSTSQYMPIRIEDVANARTDCYYKLLEFLNISLADWGKEKVDAEASGFLQYSSSYGGLKWDESRKEGLYRRIEQWQEKEWNDLLLWDYSKSSYGTTSSCLEFYEKLEKKYFSR